MTDELNETYRELLAAFLGEGTRDDFVIALNAAKRQVGVNFALDDNGDLIVRPTQTQTEELPPPLQQRQELPAAPPQPEE